MNTLTVEKINGYSKSIHEANVARGWWDNKSRCLVEAAHLICGEIHEGTEGARKNLMDEHCPDFNNEDIELADALIRTLDLGGYLGLNHIGDMTDVVDTNLTDHLTNSSIGRIHFAAAYQAVAFAASVDNFVGGPVDADDDYIKHAEADLEYQYNVLIDTIITVSKIRGYDIERSMTAKLAYNSVRPDHSREARAAEHGKKF
jgi:hypothetical protein